MGVGGPVPPPFDAGAAERAGGQAARQVGAGDLEGAEGP